MFLFCPALSSAICLIRQQVLPFTVFRTRVVFEDTCTLFPWFRFTPKIETGPTIWLFRVCLRLQGPFALCLCRTFWYICLTKHTSFIVSFKSRGEIQNCPIYIVAEAYLCVTVALPKVHPKKSSGIAIFVLAQGDTHSHLQLPWCLCGVIPGHGRMSFFKAPV